MVVGAGVLFKEFEGSGAFDGVDAPPRLPSDKYLRYRHKT